MTDDLDDYRERAESKADSVFFTYKQHFAVANFYRSLSQLLDVAVFGLASLLLAEGFWNILPRKYLLVPPLIIAGITGYRRGTKIDEKSQRFRRSARQYHSLFDEFRDFLHITVENKDLETIDDEFVRLSEKRSELNNSMPDASEFWYRYLKWKGEDRLREEISTSDETREAL